MKPEDLNPTQVLQVVALGLVFLTLLVGSMVSWGVLIYRFSKGLKFSVAQKPIASLGFVDCITGFVAVVLCFCMALITWRILILPNLNAANAAAIVSQETEPSTDAMVNPIAPTEAEKSPEVATDSELVDDQAETVTETGEPKNRKVITKEEVLGSGWLSIFQLLAAVITMIFVANRMNGDWRTLGLSSRGILQSCGIGVWVLLLMLPPIVMINVAISFASGIEYSHPIIDAIKNYPWLIGIIAFQAVVVAPITEELLFRGLLIGWFESAHFGRNAKSILFGWKPTATSMASSEIESTFGERTLISRSPYDSPPLADPDRSNPSMRVGDYSAPWWPSILSGALFGLAHFSYGVSWVPLIVFGIILGRVYQLRQSLVTCIVVHMLFNGINILNLWLSLGLPTSQ